MAFEAPKYSSPESVCDTLLESQQSYHRSDAQTSSRDSSADTHEDEDLVEKFINMGDLNVGTPLTIPYGPVEGAAAKGDLSSAYSISRGNVSPSLGGLPSIVTNQGKDNIEIVDYENFDTLMNQSDRLGSSVDWMEAEYDSFLADNEK
jgi:hypothetical protein